MATKTTAQFKADAVAKHGDRYDYSQAFYANSKTKLTITCKIHGDFKQKPDGHLSGQGCPKCAITIRAAVITGTLDNFIEKSKIVHGERYDYSKTVYTGSKTKLIIICKTHGEFSQYAGSHLCGTGCSKCVGSYIPTTKEFIEKAKAIHCVDKYDYSKTVYTGTHTKLIITCKIHGDFIQEPNRHLSGQGCPKCGGKQVSTTKEFIVKAISKHGDMYNYSRVIYTNSKAKIIIGCSKHGNFKQTPYNHLQGQNCPKCKLPTDNDAIYIWSADGVYHNGLQVYKFGVTSQRLGDKRINQVAKKRGYKASIVILEAVDNATAVETMISKLGVHPDIKIFNGSTEFRAFTPQELFQALDLIQQHAGV